MNIGEGHTQCYWLEPTGTYRLGLRRYTSGSDGQCGHDADCIVTGVEHPVVYRETECGKVLEMVPKALEPPHDSPLWPTICEECGFVLPDDTQYQLFHAEGYVRSDTGEKVWTRHVHGKKFAGALFDAWWWRGRAEQWNDGKRYVGADGIALTAVCPDGHPWHVDGPASGGGYWERSGDPRKPETLTCTPSILVSGSYHGFLQNGYFTAHIG